MGFIIENGEFKYAGQLIGGKKDRWEEKKRNGYLIRIGEEEEDLGRDRRMKLKIEWG